MQLIVWNAGIWKPGKHSDHEVRRVIFKSVDGDDKRSYYLNLDKKFPNNVAMWEPNIKEGSVLDVQVMPKGGRVTNDTTINKFSPFKAAKDVSRKEEDNAG